MLPPLIAVLPPLSVVSEVSEAEPPTEPANVVAPDVSTVRTEAPLRVLPNDTAPEPVDVSVVVVAPSVTASL
jgi:hypothetical protein